VSKALSPSVNRPYGLARVCHEWRLPRSTAQLHRRQATAPRPDPALPRRRGPVEAMSDAALVERIRAVLGGSDWVGEGYRKVWARLRHEGACAAPRRVLRLMRQHGLLAPSRRGLPPGPRSHEGTVVTDRPDQMWAIDGTGCLTSEGNATIFVLIDHCTGECLGIHAARRGTRFEALEPVRQAVRHVFGGFSKGIVGSELQLRHDHGSQFVSHAFQEEIAFLGIPSSPSFVRSPEGNGCVERFIRTLKEQLLWLRRFDTVAELLEALQDFARRFNESWILQRHRSLTPSQVRQRFLEQERLIA